ncbi:hypothetical protein HMPREF1544_01518 [Mucor circinelloides 1006PhL]|uniref:Uncharacterized protein n=1 Tax=Mucor circinelloides f. circinelloides (strain 1006PhL) TaxID=1220926 RepID=S2JMM2_MUCC1|nr:hypothetical protein HMPREF1544_01518 [Mucor circinelloides 1006PhL]
MNMVPLIITSEFRGFDAVFEDHLPGLPPNQKFERVIQLEDKNFKSANRAPSE